MLRKTVVLGFALAVVSSLGCKRMGIVGYDDPSIRLDEPQDAAVWQLGSEQQISWTVAGDYNHVSVFLEWEDSDGWHLEIIAHGTRFSTNDGDDGSFSVTWRVGTIPGESLGRLVLRPGRYRIRVDAFPENFGESQPATAYSQEVTIEIVN